MKKLLYLVQMAVLVSLVGCTSKSADTFTLWQLPSCGNDICNSYVIQTSGGKLIVMDGGLETERHYLRGYIDALGGGKVDAWFISHPHPDHAGAINRILSSPAGLQIEKIYYSRLTEELIYLEKGCVGFTRELYGRLDTLTTTEVIDCHCGDELEIDGVKFKILSEKNPDILTHYNDHSMVIRMWDDHKSVVFLGDLGVAGGRKLMESEYMKDVDCDYLQVAHHGQRGCDKEFYMTADFKACLWPTPKWVYDNDLGKGFNTAHLKTIEVREWMKEKGITEHYVSCEGLACIK